MLCGTDNPDIVKPVPVVLAAEIDTGAVPGLESVTETDPLLPTSRLPKLKLDGFAASDPCVPAPASDVPGCPVAPA